MQDRTTARAPLCGSDAALPILRWRFPDGRTTETRGRFYAASCDACGWAGSSEDCGADYWGDDSDVFCPVCFEGGADCGKQAEGAKEMQDAGRAKDDNGPAGGVRRASMGLRCRGADDPQTRGGSI